MHIERHPVDERTQRRRRRAVTIVVGLACAIGLYLWIDEGLIPCGPETAGDTAGLCQGPSPASP